MARDTRTIILDTAEFLIRTRGYSAFSFADLAESAGITKASVHYHFPSKESLVQSLVSEYVVRRVPGLLAEIRQQHANAVDRLRAYGDLFLRGFENGVLPFCGALSAERSALPTSVHPALHDLFRLQLDWIAQVLEDGRSDGSIAPHVSPLGMAPLILSVFEGAIFIGWGLQQKEPALAAVAAILQGLEEPQQEKPDQETDD